MVKHRVRGAAGIEPLERAGAALVVVAHRAAVEPAVHVAGALVHAQPAGPSRHATLLLWPLTDPRPCPRGDGQHRPRCGGCQSLTWKTLRMLNRARVVWLDAGSRRACGRLGQPLVRSAPEHETSEVPMAAIVNGAEWFSRAACLTADPELFFPISSSGPARRQAAEAKAICTRCQLQQACLGYALDAGPVQGIWGGTTEEERRLLRQRQRETRPPSGPGAGSRPGPCAASPVAVTCITGGTCG